VTQVAGDQQSAVIVDAISIDCRSSTASSCGTTLNRSSDMNVCDEGHWGLLLAHV
jgi:hypothetical protein